MSPRNCLYILLFWIQTTHANIFEELLIAVKSIEDKVNILNERVENENKKIVSELNLMKENIEKIDSKLNDARGNDYMINLKSNMGYLSRGRNVADIEIIFFLNKTKNLIDTIPSYNMVMDGKIA